METNREKHHRASLAMINSLASLDRATADPKSKKEQIEKLKFDAEKKCVLARDQTDIYTKSIGKSTL